MTFRRGICGLIVVAAVASLAAYQPPRQPAATFTSGSAIVPIFATVSDADHRLVPTLTADDFAVLDNGQPQPITVFGKQVSPITVVVLLDTSDSMRDTLGLLSAAAEQFIGRLLPADRAELGAFNQAIRFARPFTSSHETLTAALRSLGGVDFGTALWGALNESLDELHGIDGRKVILVFTDGENNIGRLTRERVGDRARDENVMVYAITLETDYTRGGKVFRSKPDPWLVTIADETGGGYFALKDSADLNATFVRVAEELHHQYALGFAATRLDGKVHRLALRVTQPGMMARGRRSYRANAPPRE